ncbi:MAG: Nramp family divalent metal transporter [Candidatus Latescibacter sp.]|nr:Nramp family divalent metal transporter [Candidatus Latescibacter sp.]
MASSLSNNIFVRFFREVIGPAAVVAAGMIGAGAVATRLLAGAWFGTSLLWSALYVIPMVIFCLDSASRVGTLTGRGMMDMIRKDINPALAWFIFIPTFLLNIVVNMSQFSVMIEATYGVFGMAPPARNDITTGVIVVGITLLLLILGLVLYGGYKRLEKSMTWLLLVILVCFIIVALKALLDWHTWVEVAKGLVPNIPANLPIAGTDPVQYRNGFTQLMSIAGQALPASVFLAYGYFTANANYKAVDLKASFKKTVINMGIIWGAFSVVVVVAGYFALNLQYQGTGAPGDLHFSQISTVPQAGMVLAPAMPDFMGFLAYRIFSLGLFAAAFTTLISVAMIMVYFTLDIVGRDWKITQENKASRITLALWIAVPAILAPLWKLDALLKAIIAMVGNLILCPLAVLIILYFVNNRKYVGDYTAKMGRNIILVITLLYAFFIVAYGTIHDFIPAIQKALAG